jgi:hypothetical protein
MFVVACWFSKRKKGTKLSIGIENEIIKISLLFALS